MGSRHDPYFAYFVSSHTAGSWAASTSAMRVRVFHGVTGG